MNARPIFSTVIIAVLSLGSLCLTARAQTTAPGPAPSQTTPSTSGVSNQLTLEEAIKAALTRNYTIRTADNTARRGQLEATRAKDNMWLPSVSANAGYQYKYSLNPQTTSIFLPTDTLGGPRVVTVASGAHTLNYGVGAKYNLFNGGSDAAQVRAAEESLDAAKLTLTWTKQQIAYNVTFAYINVLRTDELTTAAQLTLNDGLAQLNLIRGKYEAGVLPIGQVYQQEAVVGQDSLGLIQARNDFQNAKADLLFLLNVPPNEYNRYGLSLTGIDTSTSLAARAAVDTSISNTRINAAIDARPDITAERHAIQARINSAAATRGGLLPSLDANAGIDGGGSNSDLTRIHFEHALTVGLSLSIPIFDKNQIGLLAEEADIDVQTEQIKLEQDVQQIRSDAAKAVNNLRAADEALDATEGGLRAALESQRLAEERLRVGAGTQTDVVIAEAAVETARTNRVNAKFNFVLAQRQLAYSLGQTNY